MGRFSWFVAGTLVGSVQVLNTVYENEQLKQAMIDELRLLYRMKNFVRFPSIN